MFEYTLIAVAVFLLFIMPVGLGRMIGVALATRDVKRANARFEKLKADGAALIIETRQRMKRERAEREAVAAQLIADYRAEVAKIPLTLTVAETEAALRAAKRKVYGAQALAHYNAI